MENQRYALPDLSSTTPTDFRLLDDHLRPNSQRYMSERMNHPGGVNDRLPRMDPWELPGMPPDKEAGKKRREKYFLADCLDLLRSILGTPRALMTSQGFWQSRGSGWGIRDESNPSRFAGKKMTYDFHTGHPSPSGGGTKTKWVMNVYLLIGVYFLVGPECYVQHDMVLCHVFENNSPDYDPRPKCAAFHQPPNGKGSLSSTYPCSYQHSGKPCNQAIHGPSSSSSLSTNPVSDQTLHPELTSYIKLFENVLLGEPDTSTDTGSYDARGGGPCTAVIASGENGQSRKRTRTSSVWERFTKIFEHGPDGVVVTLAVCNHCCKVLTGDSKNGTSHLARHKCQCNHGSKFSRREPHCEAPPPPFDPPTPLAPSRGCRGPSLRPP